jgi:hypothetical protein
MSVLQFPYLKRAPQKARDSDIEEQENWTIKQIPVENKNTNYFFNTNIQRHFDNDSL